MSLTSFDLTSRPWVPVVNRGRSETVSLAEAMTRAHELDGLDFRRPLEGVVVLRVLLAVLLDACGQPENEDDWQARWEHGRIPVDPVVGYLDTHRAAFDLLSEQRPFAQTPGLHTARDEVKPLSVLLADVPAGNNVPLWGAVTDGVQLHLTPAQAARALLAAIAFDTAAIKSGAVGDPRAAQGKTTGNPTGPLGQLGIVIPTGRTLAETLLLNTPIARNDEHPGTPVWRRGLTPAWTARRPDGLLDLLTWPARRVRLVHTAGSTGNDPAAEPGEQAVPGVEATDVVVTGVVVAAGDRMPETPTTEPHTLWRIDATPAAGRPTEVPRRHQPGQALWRGLPALLAVAAGSGTTRTSRLLDQVATLTAQGVLASPALRVVAIGVAYGTQSAVIDDVYFDELPLPVAALLNTPARSLLLDVAEQADGLRRAANAFADGLRLAVGGDKAPWDRSLRLGDALLHRLDPGVRRLLAGLQRDPDRDTEAREAWSAFARSHALALVDPAIAATPASAFLGRGPGRPAPAIVELFYRQAVTKTLGPPPAPPTSSINGLAASTTTGAAGAGAPAAFGATP